MSARPPFRGLPIRLRGLTTDADLARALVDGAERDLGRQLTGDDLRLLGERLRGAASELVARAGEADRARARGEGR